MIARARQSALRFEVAVFLCGFVMLSAAIRAKDRQWEVGTWRDTVSRDEVIGTHSTIPPAPGELGGGFWEGFARGLGQTTTVLKRNYRYYLIETDTLWIVAAHRVSEYYRRPVPMTVNAPARLAFDKDKRSLWVLGEDDKEYKLDIVKKVLKAAAPR